MLVELFFTLGATPCVHVRGAHVARFNIYIADRCRYAGGAADMTDRPGVPVRRVRSRWAEFLHLARADYNDVQPFCIIKAPRETRSTLRRSEQQPERSSTKRHFRHRRERVGLMSVVRRVVLRRRTCGPFPEVSRDDGRVAKPYRHDSGCARPRKSILYIQTRLGS